MGYTLGHTLSTLNQARQKRAMFCVVRRTEYTVQFLHTLRAHHLIYGFGCTVSNAWVEGLRYVFVYFRFHKYRPTFRGIRIFSTPGHRRWITYDRFTKLARSADVGQIFITNSAHKGGLFTSKGFEYRYNRNDHRSERRFKCGELVASAW